MGACLCRLCYDRGNHSSTSDWMSLVSDHCSVTNLSMPGTHESMCRYGTCLLQCQSRPLFLQYRTGIRFVDIRCRHFNDELPIHHNAVYQHANFDDVLTDTLAFLDAHSQEVVLMRVKEEFLPEHNTKTFADTVQEYVNRYPSTKFWRGNTFPVMGEARGKLIILRDYWGPATFGLSYENLDVEDMWDIGSLLPTDIDKKWVAVKRHLEKAKQGPPGTMYLTYSSGTGVFAWPHAVARRMNNFLRNFFVGSKGKKRFGIVAMDFPNAILIGKIINSNYD